MHRDAEDPLHGAEDLADYLLAPVGSVLRDDNGLPDFCNESTPEDYYYAPTGLIIHAKTPLLIRRQSKSPPSMSLNLCLFIYLAGLLYISVIGKPSVLTLRISLVNTLPNSISVSKGEVTPAVGQKFVLLSPSRLIRISIRL